ncbi:MAG TPA: response regulator [Jiangellaceae bacterium]|nr:response regulator [Jiangellaceae bacterium]
MAEVADRKAYEEINRLRADLAAARQQQSATSEILTALGKAASDLDAILGTVVESAQRLCTADVSQIHLVDGDLLRLARAAGSSQEVIDYMVANPVDRDRRSLIGRVALYGRTQQITDVLADPEYGRLELQSLAGLRTTLGVPMVLDDDLVGVMVVWRTEVDPFDDRAEELLTTFAAQAAIALRSVNLVRALEARSDELARKVEQLEALAEVGQVVSSSLDVDEVLSTIVTHAVQLSGTDGGSIFEFDDAEQEFNVRTAFGTSTALVDDLRRTRITLTGTLVGRAATLGHPEQVPDLRQVPLDPHLQRLHDAGWLSVVAVPMLREGTIVGALVVRRMTPGGFSDETCDLLETFASQSALAILNARLFRELELKSAELEVASKHKSEFLASMSHELRTPLNAVIGFSEVLLERMFGDLNERQDEYLRDIWGSGKHLLELLNEILDLSKIEAGQMILERSTFGVRDALEYSMSLVRERAARHGIALNLEVGSGVDLLDADELRFKQVVLNLLSNAVKFTDDGGRVSVRATSQGTELVVTVSDTGMGVPPEDRERIFESFQQGKRAAPKAEGTGLGLTLSKRIVELHGGRIWLESEVGVGSTFCIGIPASARMTSGQPMTEAPDIPWPSVANVVVVEDDRRSSELLALYLRGAGVEVVTARDGEEGLALIRRLRPTGVVLDIRLPKLDGWDLLALLKADPATAPIPVIIVSMLDERGKGFALGAAEYLVKPVGRDDVLSALARVTVLPDRDRLVVAIDDDRLAVDLVRAVLEPEGWTVLGATSGAEGLALATARQPAVVLLDLLMPGMDGFALVDALRRAEATKDIPIIVLTSKTMTAQDKDRLNGQISYVARKAEFDSAALLSLVERVTSARTSRASEAP